MTGRVRVKICGITRPDDGWRAAELGADAIGMIFWRSSPRVVDVPTAIEIVRNLPPFVSRVGVFVNAKVSEVWDVVRQVRLDVVQLHGDETAVAFEGVGARLVKAVTLEDAESVDAACHLPGWVTPLIDATDVSRRGGTGRVANWTLAAKVARKRPMILAGGLTAANVGDALRSVAPWGVDVSSGVESAPGIKDPERLREFFNAVAQGRQGQA
jgi:phosphoribosylanthranilate isomerase